MDQDRDNYGILLNQSVKAFSKMIGPEVLFPWCSYLTELNLYASLSEPSKSTPYKLNKRQLISLREKLWLMDEHKQSQSKYLGITYPKC